MNPTELKHFKDLIERVCRRPDVYLVDDFDHVAIFLNGYSAGYYAGESQQSGDLIAIGDMFGEEWLQYLSDQNGWEFHTNWEEHILNAALERRESPFNLLREVYQAFYEAKQHALVQLAECAEDD